MGRFYSSDGSTIFVYPNGVRLRVHGQLYSNYNTAVRFELLAQKHILNRIELALHWANKCKNEVVINGPADRQTGKDD
jgi:hypothetical protein